MPSCNLLNESVTHFDSELWSDKFAVVLEYYGEFII